MGQPAVSLMDILALEQYGDRQTESFNVQSLLFLEQYGGYQGRIGIQVRLHLEQYGNLQGQSLTP